MWLLQKKKITSSSLLLKYENIGTAHVYFTEGKKLKDLTRKIENGQAKSCFYLRVFFKRIFIVQIFERYKENELLIMEQSAGTTRLN